MTRKDTRLTDWWNDAFARMKQTSQYKDICRRVDAEHGKWMEPNHRFEMEIVVVGHFLFSRHGETFR